MKQAAQIHEVDQIHKLREALTRFKVQADGALGVAQMEIQRTLMALDQLLDHWQAEIHRCHEDVNRARSDLGFHRSLHKGEHVGETELQMRVKKAQARLRHAEEKFKLTQRWQRLVPQAIHNYEGPARSLGGFLDTELRKALVVLDNQTAALEAYLALHPMESEPVTAPPANKETTEEEPS